MHCYQEDSYADSDDGDPHRELYVSFKLPEDEYGETMFGRRLAVGGSSSPPALSQQPSIRSHANGTRQSTIADSEGEHIGVSNESCNNAHLKHRTTLITSLRTRFESESRRSSRSKIAFE